MVVTGPFRNAFDLERQIVPGARDGHAGLQRTCEMEERRIRDAREFFSRVGIGAVALNWYPSLSFVVQDHEVFGLILGAISPAIVVECKGDSALAIRPHERKIIRHVDQRGRGERTGRDRRLGRRCGGREKKEERTDDQRD